MPRFNHKDMNIESMVVTRITIITVILVTDMDIDITIEDTVIDLRGEDV